MTTTPEQHAVHRSTVPVKSAYSARCACGWHTAYGARARREAEVKRHLKEHATDTEEQR
jgi:hypothetical protein